MKSGHFAARAAVVFLALTPLVKADIISSLGNTTLTWASGSIQTTVAVQTAQMADPLGTPVAFTALCGNLTTMDCTASWTFNYLFPAGQTVSGATLTLGIVNLESKAPGERVKSYLVGSTDLAAGLNSAAKALDGGIGSIRNEYDILTIPIPSSDFATLETGSTNVSLALEGQGLGLGTLPPPPFYTVGLMFSTLDIKTAAPVPEPAALPLLLTAVGAFGLLWARRKSNHRG